LLPSASGVSGIKKDGKAPWDQIELGTVTNKPNESIENEDKKKPGPETCASGPDGKQTGEENVQLAANRRTSRSGCRIKVDIFILALSFSSTAIRQFAAAAISQIKTRLLLQRANVGNDRF
jgi:hypothetical protein